MDTNESRLRKQEQYHWLNFIWRRSNALGIRDALYQLKGRKNLVGCEIGVAFGYHAHAIFRTLDIQKLYLIDPYNDADGVYPKDTRKSMFRLLKKYMPRIRFCMCDSDEAVCLIPDSSLDFIYIDGLHSYKQVKKDINNYVKKLKPGGIICGHNFEVPGVAKAVVECLGTDIGTSYYTVDWWKRI